MAPPPLRPETSSPPLLRYLRLDLGDLGQRRSHGGGGGGGVSSQPAPFRLQPRRRRKELARGFRQKPCGGGAKKRTGIDTPALRATSPRSSPDGGRESAIERGRQSGTRPSSAFLLRYLWAPPGEETRVGPPSRSAASSCSLSFSSAKWGRCPPPQPPRLGTAAPLRPKHGGRRAGLGRTTLAKWGLPVGPDPALRCAAAPLNPGTEAASSAGGIQVLLPSAAASRVSRVNPTSEAGSACVKAENWPRAGFFRGGGRPAACQRECRLDLADPGTTNPSPVSRRKESGRSASR